MAVFIGQHFSWVQSNMKFGTVHERRQEDI